jgi:glycosyltransferase involved in cell wall biosynthesis
VNVDIVDHGRNGYLADTPEQWLQILNQLVADKALREAIGAAGRRRVEEEFALPIQAVRLVDALERAAA